MPINDQQRVFSGQSSFASGMDSGKRGNLILEDAYQDGENVVCRGGNIGTRPRFVKRPVTYLNTLAYGAVGTPIIASSLPAVGHRTFEVFAQGLFQGACYYDPLNDVSSFIVMVGGRMFQVVPRRTSMQVTEVALDKQNRADIPMVFQVQADRFLLTQDGESSCLIYDGVNARRAGKNEIPVGTIMSYGMGRVVLVGTNRRDILFGDLYGSHPGNPGDSVLQFTETTYLAEGGAASIPFTMGHIKAAFFYPQQDTSMGQGELIVAAENGMASFFLSQPREQWKNSAFQRMALLDIGGRGHRAFTPFNGDVWFRAGDGWRAYRQARAEAKGWFQLPLSVEVGNYVNAETQSLLEFGSSIRFNNRLIVTANPVPNQGKPYHSGLLSLDFDVLSSFGQARKPSWDGHWSGLKVLQLVEGIFDGEHRAFAIALDSDGLNAFYELSESEMDTEDSDGPVTSWVVPRRFSFDAPFNETKVQDMDVWIEGVKSATYPEVYFKPDGYPRWLPWNQSVGINALLPIDGVGEICDIPTRGEGFSPRLGIGTPLVDADELSTKRDLKRAYEVDMKIKWLGNMQIKQLRFHDRSQVERVTANIPR